MNLRDSFSFFYLLQPLTDPLRGVLFSYILFSLFYFLRLGRSEMLFLLRVSPQQHQQK